MSVSYSLRMQSIIALLFATISCYGGIIVKKQDSENIYQQQFFNACRQGKIVSIKRLLTNPTIKINEPDELGASPLYMALFNFHDEIATLLVEHGADVNFLNKQSGKLVAELVETASLLQFLIDRGLDIHKRNSAGVTLLQMNCRSNEIEILQLLIKNGADVNAQANNGSNPLFMAALACSDETIKILLEHGAKINILTNFGETPVFIASAKGAISTVKLLLEHGANIHLANQNGEIPLHVAAQFNRVEVIELLLKHGADINRKDKDGNTPLHKAAQYRSGEAVKLLLKLGADSTLKNAQGQTFLTVDNLKELTDQMQKIFLEGMLKKANDMIEEEKKKSD